MFKKVIGYIIIVLAIFAAGFFTSFFISKSRVATAEERALAATSQFESASKQSNTLRAEREQLKRGLEAANKEISSLRNENTKLTEQSKFVAEESGVIGTETQSLRQGLRRDTILLQSALARIPRIGKTEE